MWYEYYIRLANGEKTFMWGSNEADARHREGLKPGEYEVLRCDQVKTEANQNFYF